MTEGMPEARRLAFIADYGNRFGCDARKLRFSSLSELPQTARRRKGNAPVRRRPAPLPAFPPLKLHDVPTSEGSR